jgi:YD repeat-containing protein
VNTAGLPSSIDANGNTIYTHTDQWGTTTTYDAAGNKLGSSYTWTDSWSNTTTVSTYDAAGNFISSTTKDANNVTLSSYTYTYDAQGNYTGYSYFDGVTTTTYDQNWNVISSSADVTKLTAVTDAQGNITGYSHTDQWGTTYYDTTGKETGSISTYTNYWDGSVSTSHYDAKGNYLGSETKDAQGNLLYSNFDSFDAQGVRTGSTSTYVNTWDGSTTVTHYNANGYTLDSTTTKPDAANPPALITVRSETYTYDANGAFTGATIVEGKTTTTYDASWNVTSTSTDTTGMAALLDANNVQIGYSSAPDQNGTSVHYNMAGVKIGSSSTYTNPWDLSVSTTRYDAQGNFISSETKGADGTLLYSNANTYANGVVTGSTSTYFNNWDGSTTVTHYNANGYTLDSTTTKPDVANPGTVITVRSETYTYTNGVFAGATFVEGKTTTTYDANWNVLSVKGDIAGLLQAVDGAGNPMVDAAGNPIYSSAIDQWGQATLYNSLGDKIGSMYVYTNTWDNSVSMTRYDVNGNYVGSDTHDANGQLLYSNINHYAPDANGLMQVTGSTSTSFSNWNQATTVTNFDANGRLLDAVTTKLDALGATITLSTETRTYDAVTGNFTGATIVEGAVTTKYDANWSVISSTANVNGMTPVYAVPGDTTSAIIGYSTGPDQSGMTTYYDLNGIETGTSYRYTNWDSSVTVTRYDANGNYQGSETRDAQGNLKSANSYTYDANGNLIGSTQTYVDWNGNLNVSTYDAHWNMLTSVTRSPAGALVSDTLNTYDQNGNQLSSVTKDGAGNVTAQATYLYDAQGFLIGHSSTYQHTFDTGSTTSTYDNFGNLLSSEDRDAAGNVLLSTVNTYDAAGHQLTSETTNANGVVIYSSTYTYDAQGQLSARSTMSLNTGDGNTTTSSYDGASHLLSRVTTDASGKVIDSETNSYNAQGQLTGRTTLTTNWDGSVSTSTYDGSNRLVSGQTVDAAGNVLNSTTSTFDPTSGVLISTVTVDGTGKVISADSYTYDASGVATGRVTIAPALNGGTTTSTFGTQGELLTTVNKDAAGTVLNTMTNTYRADGLLVHSATTDAANVVLASSDYAFDPTTGQFTGYTGFDGIWTTTVDAALVKTVSAPNTSNMTAIMDAAGAQTGWRYDLPSGGNVNNSMTAAVLFDMNLDKTGSITISVDSLSHNINERTRDLSGNVLTNVTKDQLGNVLRTKTNAYDAAGNLTGSTAVDSATTTTMDAQGHILTVVVNNPANLVAVLDGAGAVTGYTHTNDGSYFSFDPWTQTQVVVSDRTVLQFDANKSFIGSTWTTNDPYYFGGDIVVYSFDAADKVISAEISTPAGVLMGSAIFTYDANGKATGQVANDGVISITFDTQGNPLAITALNTAKMTAVKDAAGALTGYSYTTQAEPIPAPDNMGNANYGYGVNTLQFDAQGIFTGGSSVYDDGYGTTTDHLNAQGWVLDSTYADYSGQVMYSTAYTYDPANGHKLTATNTNALGEVMGVTTHVYDAGTGLRTSSSSVDANGNLMSTRDYTYDTAGNQLTITNKNAVGAVMNTTTNHYDAAGNFTGQVVTDSYTDPFSNRTTTTTWEYDAFYNPTSQAINDGVVTTTIDPNYNYIISQVADPAQVATLMPVNDTTNPFNNSYRYHYTGAGYYNYGSGTEVYFDATGLRVGYSFSYSNGVPGGMTDYFYRADGQQHSFVQRDAAGAVLQTETFTYDAQMHQTGSVTVDANNAVLFTTVYALDSNGNQVGSVSKDAAGNIQSAYMQSHDANGQYVGYISQYQSSAWNGTTYVPATDVEVYGLGSSRHTSSMLIDATGNVMSTTTWQYDATGNNTGRVVNDGMFIMTYDAVGNLISALPIGSVPPVTPPVTPPVDTTGPSVVDAWADGAGSFGIVFNENITFDPLNMAGLSVLKNGNTPMTLTGASIDPMFPNEIVMTYSDSLVGGDYIYTVYNAAGAGNNVTDLAGNPALSGIILDSVGMGPAAVGATADFSNAILSFPFLMRGNAGVDVFTGTRANDTLDGGRGADILTGGLGSDTIKLGESTPASDTVVIGVGDSAPSLQGGTVDMVYGFDTVSGATNDILDLPGSTIAIDTAGMVAGSAFGSITAHSIVNGIITFSDANGVVTVTANSPAGGLGNWDDVNGYMQANIADGATVAANVDVNGDGTIGLGDSLAVFQGNATTDVLVHVFDTSGQVAGLTNTLGLVNAVTII